MSEVASEVNASLTARMSGMVPGNWGVTAARPVEWLHVAVAENYASPEALANGPIVNDTVTGTARAAR